MMRGSFRHVRTSERRRSHFAVVRLATLSGSLACLREDLGALGEYSARSHGPSWQTPQGAVWFPGVPTAPLGSYERGQLDTRGYRRPGLPNASRKTVPTAGCRITFVNSLGVEVEHGSPEGIQRPFGSFRDGLRSVSRLLTLSCHRAVRRVRSSAAAPRATLPEPVTFGSETIRAPHTRNRSVVHHDDGHHDDSHGDLPDGEPGLGQWRESHRRVRDARLILRDTRGAPDRGTRVWSAEIPRRPTRFTSPSSSPSRCTSRRSS